jgi:AcrR family transcriptional regulator
MGVQERRSRQKETLRREILDAARDLFARDGYENVSMRRIAEKIEYSPTTIYLHFKDKAELLHHVCEDMFGQLADQLERVGKGASDPVAALRQTLRAYVDFGLRNPQHYRVVFMMPAEYTDMPAEEYFRVSQGGRAFRTLGRAVESCVQAGRFGASGIARTTQILWAGVHGVTSLLIAHPDFPWAERGGLIDGMIDTLLGGLERQ